MIGLWRRLRRPRVRLATQVELADFLAARAAFVSQKSTVEFCRARAGLAWDRLLQAGEFKAAVERARWEAYVAALEDAAEVALIFLRQSGAAGAEVVDGLAAAAGDALTRHPPPPHRPDWADAVAALEARLRRSLLAAPRSVQEMGRGGGRRVFEALPMQTSLGSLDREMVVNKVRLLLCRVYADMEAELDAQALACALSLPPSAAGGSPRRPAPPPGPP